MSHDHSIRGIRYYDCDLCGFTYRITDTTINSAGLRVCRFHDVDEGDYMYAPVQTYDPSRPTFYDVPANEYYQLRCTDNQLFTVGIPNLGGWIPPPYGAMNLSTGVMFQVVVTSGSLYIDNNGAQCRNIPPFTDTDTDEQQQLIVVNESGINNLAFIDVTPVVNSGWTGW